MASYDAKKFFEGVLSNDESLTFEVTEELVQIGVYLGTHFKLVKLIYKTYRKRDNQFEYTPMVGTKLSVLFDYEEQQVTFTRYPDQVVVTLTQFLHYMGKIDVAFAPIYPVGTTVELDETMLPKALSELFKEEGLGAIVTLTGRKIPLITGFDPYIIDYLGRLWPFGERPGDDPILISNQMIKRVVTESHTNAYEEAFAFDVLRATQVLNQQVSTAYMTTEEAKHYYETLTGRSKSE